MKKCLIMLFCFVFVYENWSLTCKRCTGNGDVCESQNKVKVCRRGTTQCIVRRINTTDVAESNTSITSSRDVFVYYLDCVKVATAQRPCLILQGCSMCSYDLCNSIELLHNKIGPTSQIPGLLILKLGYRLTTPSVFQNGDQHRPFLRQDVSEEPPSPPPPAEEDPGAGGEDYGDGYAGYGYDILSGTLLNWLTLEIIFWTIIFVLLLLVVMIWVCRVFDKCMRRSCEPDECVQAAQIRERKMIRNSPCRVVSCSESSVSVEQRMCGGSGQNSPRSLHSSGSNTRPTRQGPREQYNMVDKRKPTYKPYMQNAMANFLGERRK